MIQALEIYLKQRLKKELPGITAHAKMTNNFRVREMMLKNKKPREAGVLILIYWHQEDLHIPMIMRPIYKGVHSGQMAFPGGKIEEQDKDLIDTALRETYEEIGVQKEKKQVLGVLTDLYIPPSNTIVTPVVALANSRPDFTPDPREVAAIHELTLNDFIDPKNKKEVSVSVADNYSIKTPSFVINGNVIWGASAMIMSELLHILEDFLD